MITIKLPYKTSEHNLLRINTLIKEYSSVFRSAYNRFNEGLKQKEVRHNIKTLNNISNLDSWLIQNAVIEAQSLKKRFKDEKVIFGGKKNFLSRLTNKITAEQFKEKKLSSLNIQGEVNFNGNRAFKLDIAENNRIIFKVSRKEHLILELSHLRKNYKTQLINLEELNQSKGKTYSIRLSDKFIYISLEHIKDEHIKFNVLNSRHLGIDLNPNHIGISIKEDDNILYTKHYDLSALTKQITSERNSSSSTRFKYLNNKLNQ